MRGLRWLRGERGQSFGLVDLRSPVELLNAWRAPVELGAGYTMGDLFRLFARMTPRLLRAVEELTDMSIAPFLAAPWRRDPVRRRELAWVEISKTFEIDDHDERRPFEVITDQVECLGRLRRPFVDRKAGARRKKWLVALAFTPWDELRPLPLRIAPTGIVRQCSWRNGKAREVAGLPELTSRRWLAASTEKRCCFELTFGELITAVVDAVCCHGSPAGRDAWRVEIERRIASSNEADQSAQGSVA